MNKVNRIWNYRRIVVNEILGFHNSYSKQLSIDDMENIRRCSKLGL